MVCKCYLRESERERERVKGKEGYIYVHIIIGCLSYKVLCQDNGSFVYCEIEEHRNTQHQLIYETPAPVTVGTRMKL